MNAEQSLRHSVALLQFNSLVPGPLCWTSVMLSGLSLQLSFANCRPNKHAIL